MSERISGDSEAAPLAGWDQGPAGGGGGGLGEHLSLGTLMAMVLGNCRDASKWYSPGQHSFRCRPEFLDCINGVWYHAWEKLTTSAKPVNNIS